MPILFISTPSLSVPIFSTIRLMWFRICLLDIRRSLFCFWSQNVLTSDVSDVFGYESTLLIVAAQIFTGHSSCPDLCWVILASFSPFFWLINVIVTQSADCIVVNVDECANSMCVPFELSLKKRMFSTHRIFVFRSPSPLFGDEYSHDLMAKKSAPHARSPIASVSGDDFSLSKCSQTRMGRHCWDCLGGSEFV